MSQPIRVGFIGLSPAGWGYGSGSWAVKSHLPYFASANSKDFYGITAVQNSSKDAATKAIKAFDLGDQVTAHGDPTSIANDPNVDLVAVSVKVPNHFDATIPALHVSKDVFVEWPLARNLIEVETLVQLARENHVKTLIGLQARSQPSIIAAKNLVESGTIGEVLASHMHGYGGLFGELHPEAFGYCLPIENGANLLTIPFGHVVDAMCFVLGEWTYVQATLANLRPEINLVDDNGNIVDRRKKTSHDHISVQGTLLNGGGVVTAIYEGGTNPTNGPGLIWQINGTKGTILFEGTSGHLQMQEPTIKVILKGEKQLRDVDGVTRAGEDISHPIGKAWGAFAAQKAGRSVNDGSAPTFEDALVRHRMIDAIYRSHETGSRVKYV